MKMNKLPGTDVSVSVICAGTMNWGTFNTEPEAHEQLDYAISQGVNFIDTAEMYPIPPKKELQGLTEMYVGAWLKKQKRDSLIVASKVAASSNIQTRYVPEGGRTIYDRKNILAAIDGTLERLQTDYVDIYQIHWPERETNFFGPRGVESLGSLGTPIEETLEALSEVVKAGKVRYIGISNETPWGLNEYLRLAREKGLPRVVTIQNQYSLINRTFEVGLAEICLREGVGLLPYSPLSKGVLTGKYLGGVIPPGSRFDYAKRDSDRYNPAHAQVAIQKYADLARSNGMEPAVMALAWVNQRSFVTANIIGTRSMEQIQTDVATANITLSEDVLEAIKIIYREHPDPTA
ncbi:MAG: aldo/keto reductase [Candidatus Pacebacteria bacterium]|nr:aldo/keto reductase [Candidatus Paceibacterota bacterium]